MKRAKQPSYFLLQFSFKFFAFKLYDIKLEFDKLSLVLEDDDANKSCFTSKRLSPEPNGLIKK